MKAPALWWLAGARIKAWIPAEPPAPRAKPRSWKRRRYPAQSRVRGADLSVRCEATYSPYEAQTRGTSRAYLERAEAQPYVVQQSPFEDHLDRWGMWFRPSEPDTDPYVVLSVLTEQLEDRYGIAREDVYLTRHTAPDTHGRAHDHYHAVVPAWVIEDAASGAARKVEITREDMAAIGRELVKELVLERQLIRTLGQEMEP